MKPKGNSVRKMKLNSYKEAMKAYTSHLTDALFLEKECLIFKFMQETGFSPSECEIVTKHTENGHKIWVQKRVNNET